MTRLSTHFSLKELTRSETAVRKGINNEPKEREIENLKLLCENILEPVRVHYGIPFAPSSGFRSSELNREIGSSDRSQHVKGQAVDFEIPGVPNLEVALWVKENLEYDQLILEFHDPEKDPHSGWVHVSYSTEENRYEYLEAYKNEEGKTRYKIK